MKALTKIVYILFFTSFVFSQNWNSRGTVPMTFRVTVEPYMPPGEIMSIEFWKNGAVEDPPSNPHFKPTANRRFHVPMKKIGKNQWEAIVELDTSAYEGAWADSKFLYHYNRNHFMPAMQDREPLKTPQIPDGQYMPLPSDNPTNPDRNGFGWHRRANMVQNDTINEWWWPFPSSDPVLNTSGHLSSPPNNIKSSDFNVGIGFFDWHRYYWSGIISNWMDNVVRTNATWMVIVPVRHGIKQDPPEFDFENKHSNALPDSNLVKMIKEAHKRGLKVYLNNLESLGGYMNWDESIINKEWYEKWLAERRKDMLQQATIAQEHGVELLKFNLWHVPRIIDEYEPYVDSVSVDVYNEVKAIYKGDIIMDYRDVDPTFGEKIYGEADRFKATLMLNNLNGHGYKDSDEPSVENILTAARKKMNNDVLPIYEKYKKPILIEFVFASSYKNSPGSDGVHWDNVQGYSHFYENDPSIPVDEQVQANMYEATMLLMQEYDWIFGVNSFNYGITSMYDKEVGIRGKLAEEVVRKWYRWIDPNKRHLTTTINKNAAIAPYTQGGTVSHLGSYMVAKDSTLTVTATPDSGYLFKEWTGDASGTSSTVSISMDTDKEISAIFYKNVAPGSFAWKSSSEYDSVSINKSNLDTKYVFQWTESTDNEDLTYNITDQFGRTLLSVSDTIVSVTYKELLSFWPYPIKMAPQFTLEYDVIATDGDLSTKASGGSKKLVMDRDGVVYLSTLNENIPTEYALHENYPNPFNPTTTLRFDLPEVSDVKLTIFNMLGQKVKTFNMQSTSAGYHSLNWNATNDLGAPVGAGVYLYQLHAKDYIKTRKMVLLK